LDLWEGSCRAEVQDIFKNQELKNKDRNRFSLDVSRRYAETEELHEPELFIPAHTIKERGNIIKQKQRSRRVFVEESFNPDRDLDYDQFSAISMDLLKRNNVIRKKNIKTNSVNHNVLSPPPSTRHS
jgi:hypothetical protein